MRVFVCVLAIAVLAGFCTAPAHSGPPKAKLDQKHPNADRLKGMKAAVADIEAGKAHAIFPTRRNLERLALFASIEEARADAARHEVRTITPWVEEREGRRFVCIPDGIGYPVTSEPYESARRR